MLYLLLYNQSKKNKAPSIDLYYKDKKKSISFWRTVQIGQGDATDPVVT